MMCAALPMRKRAPFWAGGRSTPPGGKASGAAWTIAFFRPPPDSIGRATGRDRLNGQMSRRLFALAIAIASLAAMGLFAQRKGGDNLFPGGANPDGSLRPTRPVTRLFTQDAYTEYSILEPGSASFRIRYLPEERRAG